MNFVCLDFDLLVGLVYLASICVYGFVIVVIDEHRGKFRRL